MPRRLLILSLTALLACDTADSPDDVDAGQQPQAVRASIDASGGKLEHPAGAALQVPAGALAEPVELSIAPVEAPSALGAPSVGAAFKLGPDGQQFLLPVEVTVPFDPTSVPEGTPLSDLRILIARDGSSEFAALDTVVDLERKVLVGKTTHFSVVVPAAPPAAVFITAPTSLPEGVKGEPYPTQTFTASGGKAPYTWSVYSGSLPAGLTLSTAGELSGTPTEAGRFTLSIRVRDSAATALVTEKSFTFDVTNPANPAPQLTSLDPETLPLGEGKDVVVSGSGFATDSKVRLDGKLVDTTYVDATRLVAHVDGQSPAGERSVTVESPAPGGGVSNALVLTVENPVPEVTSVVPDTLAAGSANTQVRLEGARFIEGSYAVHGAQGLATSFVDATALDVVVPEALLATAGVLEITVYTPAPGGGYSTGSVSITVTAAQGAPTISSVTPDTVAAGSADSTHTITGTNIDGTTQVFAGAQALERTGTPTATSISFIVPMALKATAGAITLTLKSGGLTSNAGHITVTAATSAPVITSLTPSSVLVGSADSTHTITGSGFASFATVIAGPFTLPVVGTPTATELQVTISAGIKSKAGSLDLVVSNDGIQSNAVTLSIVSSTGGALTLTSVEPTTVAQYSGDTPLVLTGTGFAEDCWVTAGTLPLPTTFRSATELAATLLYDPLNRPQKLQLTVWCPNVERSNTQEVEVTTVASQPLRIVAATPPALAVDADWTTVVLQGSGFVAGAKAYVGATELPVYFQNSSLVHVAVPTSAHPAEGVLSLKVVNPDTMESDPYDLRILAAGTPTPYLKRLKNLNQGYVGDRTISFAVVGAGFDTSSIVLADGEPVFSNFRNANELFTEFHPDLLQTSGVREVRVKNPTTGKLSEPLYVPVASLQSPRLTFVSPSEVREGSGDMFVQLSLGSGSRTNPLPKVRFRGAELTTTRGDTGLGVTIPQALLAQAGAGSLEMLDAGGNTSQPFNVVTTGDGLPTLATLSPTSIDAVRTGTTTITVSGSGITSNPRVMIGSRAFYASQSGGELTVTLSDEVLAPGVYPVRILNRTAGGGTSAEVAELTIVDNFDAPALTALHPAQFGVGTRTYHAVHAEGTDLYPGLTRVTGTKGAMSYDFGTCGRAQGAFEGMCKFEISGVFASEGSLQLSFTNPGKAAASHDLPIIAGNPTPRTPFQSGGILRAGAGDQKIRVYGDGLIAATTYSVGATPITATLLGRSLAELIIPAVVTASAGQQYLTVENPGPGGGAAPAPLGFSVGETLEITSLSPSTVAAGSGQFTLTIEGSGLDVGAYTMLQIGQHTAQVTERTATTVTATVPAAAVALPGKFLVSYRIEGKGVSNELVLTVTQ